MPKVNDPMPNVALEAVQNHREKTRQNSDTSERLTGLEWLRVRLQPPNRGKYHWSVGPAPCTDHYHAECSECGSVKCIGSSESDYFPYDTLAQQCDCGDGWGMESTEHLIVPFGNFGRHFGFPD